MWYPPSGICLFVHLLCVPFGLGLIFQYLFLIDFRKPVSEFFYLAFMLYFHSLYSFSLYISMYLVILDRSFHQFLGRSCWHDYKL